MYVGMSQLYYERNELNAADQYLLRSQELGEFAGLPQNRYRKCVVMAQIRVAKGDLDGALDLLREAEHWFERDFSPNVQPVAARKARVWIAQGKLDEALGWAHQQGLSVEDDLSYLHEFEHITLARVLLALYRRDRADHFILEAERLLQRLLIAADAGGRTGNLIEILVLQALAHQLQGDIPAALVPLQRALNFAEPEGYVRLFADEGRPMAILLQEAAQHRITPAYVHHLLKALGNAEDPQPVQQGLVEPLSERELAVLRLLQTDLTGPEIAHELIVSLSTLRTHTQNIYTKLGVNNRRAAIRRAEELALL